MLQRCITPVLSSHLNAEECKIFISIQLDSSEHTPTINNIKNCFVELVIPKTLFSEELLQKLKVNRIIIDFQNKTENADHIFALCIAYKYFPFTLNFPTAPAYQQVEFYRGSRETEDKDAKNFLQERTAEDIL